MTNEIANPDISVKNDFSSLFAYCKVLSDMLNSQCHIVHGDLVSSESSQDFG
ncbi:MAG: hypothetical protein AAF600_20140 [Bacteroidota bacterium]